MKHTKTYFFKLAFLSMLLFATLQLVAKESNQPKKKQVLDFSAGVIEGELNRPSMLMELVTNFKDFKDIIFLREDFNSYHEIDSAVRLRYYEEKK